MRKKTLTLFPKDGFLWAVPCRLCLTITYIIYINIYSSEPLYWSAPIVFIARLCQAVCPYQEEGAEKQLTKFSIKVSLAYFGTVSASCCWNTVYLFFLDLRCPERIWTELKIKRFSCRKALNILDKTRVLQNKSPVKLNPTTLDIEFR